MQCRRRGPPMERYKRWLAPIPESRVASVTGCFNPCAFAEARPINSTTLRACSVIEFSSPGVDCPRKLLLLCPAYDAGPDPSPLSRTFPSTWKTPLKSDGSPNARARLNSNSIFELADVSKGRRALIDRRPQATSFSPGPTLLLILNINYIVLFDTALRTGTLTLLHTHERPRFRTMEFRTDLGSVCALSGGVIRSATRTAMKVFS